MAILGTFVDRQSVSRAGDGLTGVTVGTLSHSLPATNPEAFLIQMRSIAALGHQPAIQPLAVGGNASILTNGFVVGSTASAPTVYYDAFAIVFHTVIR